MASAKAHWSRSRKLEAGLEYVEEQNSEKAAGRQGDDPRYDNVEKDSKV